MLFLFFNLKFLDPLNTNHYRWEYLRNKSNSEIAVLPEHFQSSNTRGTSLQRNINISDSANHIIDGELTDHSIDYSALSNTNHDTNYSSSNIHISYYYTENEFNIIQNLFL